jgi:hypothetical protein
MQRTGTSHKIILEKNMPDPFAPYRKKPLSEAEETPPPKGGDEYLAFDAKDKVDRLRIRRASAPTRAPGYAYLLDLVYDGPYGTEIVLVYTFLMVIVRGKNLLPVVMAIEMGTADYIQQFDADRWQRPKDDKAPIIDSIEVIVQENGPSISSSEKTGKGREPGRSLH